MFGSLGSKVQTVEYLGLTRLVGFRALRFADGVKDLGYPTRNHSVHHIPHPLAFNGVSSRLGRATNGWGVAAMMSLNQNLSQHPQSPINRFDLQARNLPYGWLSKL